MYLHNHDSELLDRILNGAVPEALLEEVSCRTKLYHSMGGSGPIGVQMLIDAMRKLGLGQVLDSTPTQFTDWARVPMQTRVECSDDPPLGEDRVWRKGLYRGELGAGTLCVRLAESNTLGEYYARNVKLGWSDAVKATPEQVAEAVANERVKDEPDPGMWSEVGRGTKVIVEETLGQRLDGEFIRTESDDDGLLVVVQITGERKHRRFPEDAVTVVGEVVEQEA